MRMRMLRMGTILDDVSGMAVATESNSFLLKLQGQQALQVRPAPVAPPAETESSSLSSFPTLQYELLLKTVRDLESQVLLSF